MSIGMGQKLGQVASGSDALVWLWTATPCGLDRCGLTPSRVGSEWLRAVLDGASRRVGSRFDLEADGMLALRRTPSQR